MKRVATRAVWIALAAVWPLACGQGAPPEPAAEGPGEWPQFRGPDGLGVTADTGLPEVWSPDSPNVRWQVEIPGKGNSSPIVSHGRVFLTSAQRTAEGPKARVDRFVLGLDFDSGELLWRTPIERPGSAFRIHPLNTYAVPTPATDGEVVFAHFGDVLAALDREGNRLWEKVVDPRYGEYSHYGSSSSVVLTDRAVILLQDREWTRDKPGWLAAFDKETGEEIWRQEWMDSCCSYVTPTLRHTEAGTEVMVVHAGAIVSYDTESGEPLWSWDVDVNQPVASLVAEGDIVAMFSGAHQKRIGAVLRVTGAGEETHVEGLWGAVQLIPQTSSPVLYNGLLYTIVDKGVLACWDIAGGRRLWQQRLPRGGGYMASLLAGDGKVYAFNYVGGATVIRAGREYELVSQNSLDDGGNTSPAVADSSIVFRTKSTLVRIDPEDATGVGG